jgi:hypothetical protein
VKNNSCKCVKGGKKLCKRNGKVKFVKGKCRKSRR